MVDVKVISIDQLVKEFQDLGASVVDKLMKEYREDRFKAENVYLSACHGREIQAREGSILRKFSNLGLNYYQRIQEVPEEIRQTAQEAHQRGYRERLLKVSPGSYFRGW